MPALTANTLLDEAVWLARRDAHAARVRPWVAPRLERSGRGEKHPVHDFLFTYYGYKPGKLARWNPGFGVTLAGDAAVREFTPYADYVATPEGVCLDTARLDAKRFESIAWI